MSADLALTALLIFAVTFAGGVLPLVRRWSENGLHALAALSAGIFLGLVFLHLLPEMSALGMHAPADHDGHAWRGLAAELPWVCTLAGFLLLFFVEKIWLEGHARSDQHRAVWYAAYFGLVLHTAVTGLGLSALREEGSIRLMFLGAVVAHKAGEAFSLSTLMRLAGLAQARALCFLAAYSLVAPVALLVGSSLDLSQQGAAGLFTGLACGTFLYVAVCDLLPEVFHGGDARWPKVLWVLAGALAAGGLRLWHPA